MYDATFKILLLSDPEVDISGLFTGHLTEFSLPADETIGVEFKAKNLVIDKKKYKLQFWDLGRDERFRFLLPTYCLGANAAVLLYDVSRSQTLDNIEELINIVRQKSGDVPIMLIGIIPNEKYERQVSAEEGIKIAKSRNLNGFMEYSVSTGEKVEKAFEALTRLILANKDYHPPPKTGEDLPKSTKYSKSYYELKSKRSVLKPPSKPPLHLPPLPKQTEVPIAPQDRKAYRNQIINLLSKIQTFWQLSNSRIIAVTLVQGRDTILYSTDKWDISADVARVIFSWNSMNTQFVMISGVKYSVLQCTSERLVATSIRDKSYILAVKDKEYTLILHVKPNGEPTEEGYPYIFTPPEPPDDFGMPPQAQVRAPLKEMDPENEVNCQYCGRKLSKDEQFTHSCNRFFLG